MLRLFIFIVSAMVLTILIVNFSVDYIQRSVEKKAKSPFLEETFSGIFALLDDKLKTTDSDPETTELNIHSTFKFPVTLERFEDVSLPPQAIKTLESDNTVMSWTDGAEHLYRKSQHSEYVWIVAAELNDHDRDAALLEGPVNLILERIENTPQSLHSSVIKDISTEFSFPVLSKEIATVDLDVAEKDVLLKDRLVVKTAAERCNILQINR